jgi:NDP-sugar pyrophosphorylase family protein
MKAMVFAAGLGTRLRPLTNDRPKALVEVAGRTMLEIALERLRSIGVTEAIVNTHHYAEKISQYLAANGNFGMRIEISYEKELLDTGGGLKKAAWFFLGGKSPDDPSLAPFLVHNVDVVSTIDLKAMAELHEAQDVLAMLAVQDRTTSRYLLFDEQGVLCGRRKGNDGAPEMARAAGSARALAFCGIHVISPRIFGLMTETGVFSIIDVYLRLAAQGERITAFRADVAKWRDLGTPESIAVAAGEFEAYLSGA